MNTTVRLKGSDLHKDWHVVDAAGQPLGRVATRVATLLRGKHKPTFEPHLDGGDFVIVVNAAKVRLSGKKAEERLYYSHSGYPGGLSSRRFPEQLSRFPDRVIRLAVWGMLPKGPLGKAMLRHLKVYAGPSHPHQSQIVGSERARARREPGLSWSPPRLGRLRGSQDLAELVDSESLETTVARAEIPPQAAEPAPMGSTAANSTGPEERAAVTEVGAGEPAVAESEEPELKE